MYFLLVEAAGVRQISRIYPDRSERLVTDLGQTMRESGFSAGITDSDLFLFREEEQMRLEPPQVASVVRRVLEVLRTRAEDLLDYLVVVDYQTEISAAQELERLGRQLRFARAQNAAYVTDAVLAAVAPLLETVASGELHRIVAFHNAGIAPKETFAQALYDPELSSIIDRAVAPTQAGATWLHGGDTGVMAAALSSLRRRTLENDPEIRWLPVQCVENDTEATVLQALVAALPSGRPNLPGASSDETVQQEQWALSLIQERFSQPTSALLSEGWRIGELRLVLDRWFAAAAHDRTATVVELRDIDRLSVDTAAAVLRHLKKSPEFRSPPRCRVVCTARTTPESMDTSLAALLSWETFAFAPTEHRYQRALDYWSKTECAPSALALNHRRALYVVYRLEGLLNEGLLNEIFPSVGISLAERSRIFSDLEDLGLMERLWIQRAHPAVERVVDGLLDSEEEKEIDRTIGELLESHLRSGSLSLSPSMWHLVQRGLQGSRRLERRHMLLHSLAGGAAFETVTRLLETDPQYSPLARSSESSARLRLFLRDSRGPWECRDDYERLASVGDGDPVPAAIRADFHLSMAEFLLASRDYRAALAAVKRASLLHQQGTGGAHGAAHLLMARILLVERRIADAGHYLTFAREEAREDRATDLIARSLEAARLFLVGNLSRAAGQFAELVEPLLRTGFSEWLIFAWFALGRISFELGDYRRAASQFAMTADWAAACGMTEPARTIQGWRRRARVLAEDGTRFEPAEEWGQELRAEERLFVAEGLIRDGDFGQALVELEAAENQEAAVDRWPRLGVCWDNGFAPLEDLVMANRGGNSELLRIIRAFRGWTLAHLDRQDEAATVFYGLTRGNDGLTVDPYTGLYTYLYSSILPRERSRDREDRLTVLSKSVKLLQERTSRIDDYRDKTRFLRYNVWNRRLMDVAREHNLV